MNEFSFDRAWSRGMEFISRNAGNHAIILIGLGVLVPLILQYVLMGSAGGMMNPAMLGQGGTAALTYGGGALILAVFAMYVIQTGSYFASWRNGLAPAETLGGAVGYGLLTGLLVIVAVVVVFVVVVVGVGQVSEGLAAILAVVVLLPLLAMLYTVIAAMVAVLMFLIMLLALAFGASLGQANAAMMLTGQGAIGMVIALAVFVLLFWLTARFSCATSAMAERRTFNLFTGLAESWRLTGPGQWRIMGYLALIAIVLCVIFFVLALLIGASMMGSMQSGAMPQPGIGTILFSVVIGIGLAYLTVLVPAGIYRSLSSENRAEVFA